MIARKHVTSVSDWHHSSGGGKSISAVVLNIKHDRSLLLSPIKYNLNPNTQSELSSTVKAHGVGTSLNCKLAEKISSKSDILGVPSQRTAMANLDPPPSTDEELSLASSWLVSSAHPLP